MNHSPITIEAFMGALNAHPDLPVTFLVGDKSISPGYHLTEVKVAKVDSLDCGQAQDQWYELIIQLLDGNAESKLGFMPANKFMHILDKALAGQENKGAAQLFFEFSPGNTGLQKLTVQSINVVDKSLVVTLNGLSSQCKAFDRALAGFTTKATTNSSGAGCCG